MLDLSKWEVECLRGYGELRGYNGENCRGAMADLRIFAKADAVFEITNAVELLPELIQAIRKLRQVEMRQFMDPVQRYESEETLQSRIADAWDSVSGIVKDITGQGL